MARAPQFGRRDSRYAFPQKPERQQASNQARLKYGEKDFDTPCKTCGGFPTIFPTGLCATCDGKS